MNWARSYVEQQKAHMDQLRTWAGSHSDVAFDVDGEVKFPCQMTECEMRDVARREAEKDVQRGINEWNASEAARKRRRGEL